MERRMFIKAAVLLLLVLGAVWLVTRPEFQAYLSKQAIQSFVQQYGLLAPIAFIAVTAIGGMLLVPVTVFIFAGAVLFGTWWGFGYSMLGATLAAIGSFYIARLLGRELVQRVVGDRLHGYNQRIAEHGFATVLYLRLAFVPFAVLNYGAGLTRVRFKDYLLGTVAGLVPSVFIFTFFFSKVTVTRASDLWRWEVLVAVVLLVLSLFLPYIAKRYLPRRAKEKGRARS